MVHRERVLAAAGPLGILGGMGPLASAEFVKTLYEHCLAGPEQEAPHLVLWSDPAFPDRTAAFAAGREEELLARLTAALARLADLGARPIVICCFTIHYLLPRLPPALGERVLSLVDLALGEVAAGEEKHLLLCTAGARQFRLFEEHPRWPEAAPRLVLPDPDDQARVHDTIYRLKGNEDPERLLPWLVSALERYGVRSFVAGCTEVHLLAKRLTSHDPTRGRLHCVDPLLTVARRLREGSL